MEEVNSIVIQVYEFDPDISQSISNIVLLLCFVEFSLGLSGYLVFSKYFRFNVLVGCEVPRLDLLQVICSTTPQAIEEMVSFADLKIQLYCTVSPLLMYQNLYKRS